MSSRPSKRNIHGILLLDKRIGVSSNRALQEVKRLFNAQKAGHTGSLDPLATGLLPVCFGEATKVSGMMLDDDKGYKVIIQLGVRTDTGDLEGEIIETRPVPAFTIIDIQVILEKFIGSISQVPPMYSALKLNGKKLYELARNGITVERKARQITIYELKLLATEQDSLELEVSCSKGTYIRSLAEDIGQVLGCGATVKELRRVQSGQFRIEQALTVETLEQFDEQQLLATLKPVDATLQTMPAVFLNEAQATAIKYGQIFELDQDLRGSVRLYDATTFLGLGEMRLDGKLAPKKLFNLND